MGQELLQLLAQRNFPVTTLRLFASARSAGKVVEFGGKKITIEEARPGVFGDIDVAFFAAGGPVTRALAPDAVMAAATSTWRARACFTTFETLSRMTDRSVWMRVGSSRVASPFSSAQSRSSPAAASRSAVSWRRSARASSREMCSPGSSLMMAPRSARVADEPVLALAARRMQGVQQLGPDIVVHVPGDAFALDGHPGLVGAPALQYVA